MEKHCSDRPSKLITKNQRKKPYKDIWENLNEWLDLYYEYAKSEKIFFNKVMLRKYMLIRKTLKRDFGNDEKMREYIKQLPPPWILRPWIIEIIIALCFIISFSVNRYGLKMYIGVKWTGPGGGGFDIIYMYPILLLSFIYVYMLHRREKAYIAIEKNLPQIRGIAWWKS